MPEIYYTSAVFSFISKFKLFHFPDTWMTNEACSEAYKITLSIFLSIAILMHALSFPRHTPIRRYVRF